MAKISGPSGGRSKRRIAAISTLVLLGLGALGGFYVSRVHARIAYLEQRNFRILATFAAGIEGRIEDLSSILAGVEKVASKTPEAEAITAGDLTDLKVELERLRGSLRCIEYLEPVGTTGARGEVPHQDTSPASLEATPQSLHLSYQRAKGGEIHADADIDCLLAWLTAPEAFDEILLVNDKRRTVYQSQTSGVRVRSLAAEATDESGSSLNKKGQETTLAARLTNVDDVELAGDRFMVFSQPVTLALGETEGEIFRWELVGLVRTQRLISEALRMHPSNLVRVAFVLLLSALAWPFLKLWTLGDRRALRARDALLCGLSLVMVTSLLTLGAAGWAAYDRVRTETGMELEATADEVIANLDREIAESLGALRAAARRAWHKGPDATAQGAGRVAAGGAPEGAVDQFPEKRYGGLLEENWVRYIHLDSVFFTAADGKQIFKQSVEREATQLIPVADRSYFTRARDGLLWSRHGRQFALDSIRSRNTGEPLAVVAAPWKSLLEGVYIKTASEPPLVAMAASRLPSLLHPILPPGRELAVVDESGRVLFHSRSERNLVEDFVRECEWSSRLLAMMHARTGRPFEASYWGSDRQMAVVPIEGLPWHVVVFQDKALLRTANFEALGLSGGLVLAQLVLVVLALGALRLAGGSRSLLRLCPGSEVAPCLRLLVVVLLLCVTLASAPTLMTSAGALIAGVAVPFTAVGLGASSLLRRDWRPGRMRLTALAVGLAGSLALGAGLLLTPPDAQGLLRLVPLGVSDRLLLGSPDAQEWLWFVTPVLAAWVVALWRPRPAIRLGRPGLVATAAGCAALAVLSVLPTYVFLRVVFEDRLALEVRRGQLHLARSLAQRDARVKALYSPVPGVGANGRWHQLLCETRDVHYASFAGTGFELRPQDPAGGPLCTPSDCLTTCGLPPAGEEGAAAFQARGSAPWSVFALPDDHGLPFVNAQAIQGRLVKAESSDRQLRWRISESGERFVFSYGPEATPLSQISSKIPRFRFSRSLSAFALFGASAVVVVVLLILFFRRMLLTDLRRTCAIALSELVYGSPRRMLVVCPPQAALPAEWRNAYVWLDFAAYDRAEVARAIGSLGAGDQPILVCVDHVEAALCSPGKRRSLREVLDRAFARPSARLVAVARRSPEALLPELTRDADSRRLREIHDGLAVRWAVDPGLPRSFEKRIDQLARGAGEPDGKHRAPAHQALLDECSPDAQLQQIGRTLARFLALPELRPEDVVQRVHEEAADHYRTLCGALSEAERLVLCQIADGSIPVTTSRPVLERLLDWGLVVRDPALRPMNESFRAFVLATRDRQALRAWQEAGASDLWRHLRVPFFAVLASAAAFLVLTQPGLFNSAVALASVVAAGVPTLVRAAGAVRQGLSAARGVAGS